jgi:hypothetical protein
MFTMILLLYLQTHLDVTLESSSLRGTFASKAACEVAAVRQRGPLPTPDGYAAAWHDVLCVPVARGVTVKSAQPLELGTLLQQRPPTACAADGAWRRVAQLCTPAARAPPEAQSGLNGTPGGQAMVPAAPPPPAVSNNVAPPTWAPKGLGLMPPVVRQ